ncbi:hypothetical protein ACP4OV_000764 [Aristida adscensionis]
MAGMSHRIRQRTDALDAAGNTTAAIGKGFAIGSAALVSLALFGAFVSRAGVTVVNVLSPKVIFGLVVGAMLPYWFSAMTMKSVGGAALEMVEEVRRAAVQHHPGADGRRRWQAGLRQLRQDLHRRLPPADDPAGGAGHAHAARRRRLLRRADARRRARVGGAGGDLGVQHRRRVGQRQEVHRGRRERALQVAGAQGVGVPQGGGDRGHHRRPAQGHVGPVAQHPLVKLMAVESLVFAPFFAAHGGLLFKLFSRG